MSRAIENARTRNLLTPLIASLFLASCGGGGGGGQPPPPSADPAPGPQATVAFVFPPENAIVSGSSLTVRGKRLNDEDIGALYVNGVGANSSDDFGSAVVDLEPGLNTITVESRDADGAVNARAAQLQINNTQPMYSFDGSAIDLDNRRLFVVDGRLDSILTIDLDTGVASFVHGQGRGDGDVFEEPSGLLYDKDDNRMIVLNNLSKNGEYLMAYQVDLGSNTSTLISASSVGAGPEIFPHAGVLDQSGDIAYVTSGSPELGIYGIDLDSGNRTLVSGPSKGNGPAFGFISALSFDGTRYLFAADGNEDALFRIDITTGDRVIVSDDSIGGGPQLEGVNVLLVDHNNNRAFVLDHYHHWLLSVDLSNGMRELISEFDYDLSFTESRLFLSGKPDVLYFLDSTSNNLQEIDLAQSSSEQLATTEIARFYTGSNPKGWSLSNAVFDSTADRLIVSAGGALARVDIHDGTVANLADASAADPLLAVPFRLVLDQPGSRIVAVSPDRQFDADDLVNDADPDDGDLVMTIEINGGQNTVVSGAGRGDGIDLVSPKDLAYDAGEDAIYVADGPVPAVIRIDASNGNRERLSDNDDVGPWPNFDEPFLLVHDQEGQRLLVADDPYDGEIIAVSLAPDSYGNRNYFSDNPGNEGVGPSLQFVSDMTIDPANRRVLIANLESYPYGLTAAPGQIISVDLDSGDRQLIHASAPEEAIPLIMLSTIVVGEDKLLYAISATDAVMVIDETSGQRALLYNAPY